MSDYRDDSADDVIGAIRFVLMAQKDPCERWRSSTC